MLQQNLRAKQAAQYLGVGLSTIWLYAQQGKLHPVKLSARVTVFKKSDLDALIDFLQNSTQATLKPRSKLINPHIRLKRKLNRFLRLRYFCVSI